MDLEQIKNSPIDSNCYVLYDKTQRECLIIDPGSEKNDGLLSFLLSENLSPNYIILTHEHFDHCWGVESIREKYPHVKLVCSLECSKAIQNKKRNHSVFYKQPGFELNKADITLEEISWTLNWMGKIISFYPALGHTSAGVIITCPPFVFTGDELIKDIKTVTKLKTGSKEKLNNSIILFERMKGEGLVICPGHGETFDLDEYELSKIVG